MSEPDPAEHSVPRRGDLTEGPILRILVVFSTPTLFSNLLQTLGGTINTIWVGQLLGEGALAATANGNIVVFLAFTFVFGFCWLLYPSLEADALWWSCVFGAVVTLVLSWWAYARGDWRRPRDAAMPPAVTGS